MMRVTNWWRWQRTKIVLAVIWFFIGLASIGGLETSEPTKIPNPDMALLSVIVVSMLGYSINKHRNK